MVQLLGKSRTGFSLWITEGMAEGICLRDHFSLLQNNVGASVPPAALRKASSAKPFYKYMAANEPRWELWGLDPISRLFAGFRSRFWKGWNK